jgi:sulfur relay (sulfurtransferase) DsrC/TusE family protein
MLMKTLKKELKSKGHSHARIYKPFKKNPNPKAIHMLGPTNPSKRTQIQRPFTC